MVLPELRKAADMETSTPCTSFTDANDVASTTDANSTNVGSTDNAITTNATTTDANSTNATTIDNATTNDDTTAESTVATFTTDVSNVLTSNVASTDIEHSKLEAKVELLEKNLGTTLPFIQDYQSQVSSDKIKMLASNSPSIDLDRGNPSVWCLFYINAKMELSKLDGKYNVAFAKLFKFFEEYNVVQLNGIGDKTLLVLSDFLNLVFKKFRKEQLVAKSKDVPHAIALLEHIREFHCGMRNIPISFFNIFDKIQYGTNYNNIDGVYIIMDVINCLTLFHKVRNQMSEEEKLDVFIKNMSKEFYVGFSQHLLTTNVTKSTVADKLVTCFNSLDSLLMSVEEYEHELLYTSSVSHLEQTAVTLSKSIRIYNSTSPKPSTNPNVKAGKNVGFEKRGGKKVNAVKIEHSKIAAVNTSSADDLSARPWY